MTGTSPQPSKQRLDAGGTVLRLRALQVMGHSAARIARAIGASQRAIQRIVCGDAKTVTPALCDSVARLYDRWWDKQAPENTSAERAAASTARRRAMRGGWCAGAALDDDQLDRPGYQPSHGWRPARGTGTGTGGTAAATPRKKSIA
jgi:plasmid maintenance system antidote protein VapI